MHLQTSVDGSKANVSLSGRFDFNARREFRRVTEEVIEGAPVSQIVLDFGSVSYLDSAALGMLLMCREKAESKGKRVLLANCNGTVKQVLDVANFGKLFELA